MNEKSFISFNDIFPFVRYIHMSDIEPKFHLTALKAYDCRLIYIYGGNGSITVDNIRHNVSKGCMFLWKPGIEYMYSESTDKLKIIGINFDFSHNKSMLDYPIPPEKSYTFNEDKITEFFEFTDFEAFNNPIFLKDMQIFEDTLIEMINEYTAKKRFYSQRICGMFLSLIGNIARIVFTANAFKGVTSRTIDLVLKYIHDNFNKEISNNEIALKLNFHPNYINKLMVSHTGTSLHQYIINYRLSRAINLILSTDMSITEIALHVGFKDVNYFSKSFKKKTGECPRDYRSHYWSSN